MYARVVRFTGAESEAIARIMAEIEAADGPPPGVPAGSMKLLFDEDQGTAVFVAFFETEEDMRAGDAALKEMDVARTPGTRASIDLCEVKIEREAP